jgi:hypothetical protein
MLFLNRKLSAYASCFSHSKVFAANTQFCTTCHSDRSFGNDAGDAETEHEKSVDLNQGPLPVSRPPAQVRLRDD